jgi:hypothetical protein
LLRTGSPEDWLVAINEVREEYQNEYGGPGTYTEIEWSADLSSEAQKWANEIAAKCVNGVPGSGSNPNDYGVATILNMKNPQMAVERWVMNGENVDLELISDFSAVFVLISYPHSFAFRSQCQHNPVQQCKSIHSNDLDCK